MKRRRFQLSIRVEVEGDRPGVMGIVASVELGEFDTEQEAVDEMENILKDAGVELDEEADPLLEDEGDENID